MGEISSPTGEGRAGSPSTVAQVQERAEEKASTTVVQVQEKAEEKVEEARDALRERVTAQLELRSGQAGSQLGEVVSALRSTSESLRTEGKQSPAKVIDQLSDRGDRVVGYLARADAGTMLADAEQLGRGKPWLVIVGGVTVGLMASRFLKASSRRRFEQVRGAGYGAQSPTSRAGALPRQTERLSARVPGEVGPAWDPVEAPQPSVVGQAS